MKKISAAAAKLGSDMTAQGLPTHPIRILRSADVDETRQMVADVFCDHKLRQIDAGEQLDYHHVLIDGAALGISIMRYGARVAIDPGPLGSFYLVQIPLAGLDILSADGAETTSHKGCASVHSPHHHLRMCWSADCQKLVVRVDKEALERHAVSLSGRSLRGNLEFDVAMDTEAGSGASWTRLASSLVDELRRTPSILRSPLVAAQFEQLLMTSLLEWQPNSHSPAFGERQPVDSCPRQVRLVEEYIEANCHLPLTVEDLVAVSGASGRSLFAGFRKHRGVSPMNHLRNVRMQRARHELENAAGETSVTSIATLGVLRVGQIRRRLPEPLRRISFRNLEAETLRSATPLHFVHSLCRRCIEAASLSR